MRAHHLARSSRRLRLAIGIAAGCSLVTACGTSSEPSTVDTSAATPTCTTATTGSTAPTEPTDADRAELLNTGPFTFDVECERFGNCACDAALSEPLTTTLTFTDEGVTFTNDEGSITYPRDPAGGFRLVVNEAKQKVATIHFTDTGFVFDMTVAGAPCSTHTYTRR